MKKADLSNAQWFKSTRSGGNGGDCVEVAFAPGGMVAVRDSENLNGPVLVFTNAQWDAFLLGVLDGEFFRP
jgi:hypothetical protein